MKCEICPRRCGTNRKNGEYGVCGMPEEVVVARAAPHYWEEPCISGEKGSGTVFFSGCNLHCVYCQNYKIASDRVGKIVSVSQLAGIFSDLQQQGCHNINLVTAGHYAPQIKRALELVQVSIPVVYNTSSYESVETLQSMEGLIDIYLADMKYLDRDLAGRYSRAEDYPEVAKAALREMVRQVGSITYEKEGKRICEATEYPDDAMMKKGVIVRHLILPGQTGESKRVLRYLYETYGDLIAISIMNQYTPLSHVAAFPELNRRVTEEEYEEVVEYALELGIGHGFFQEGPTAEESFIPEFYSEFFTK